MLHYDLISLAFLQGFQSLTAPCHCMPCPQFAIEQARFYDKCNLASGADRTSCQVGQH